MTPDKLLDWEGYWEFCHRTNTKPCFEQDSYGLLEEAGEFAGKCKRLYREHHGKWTPEVREQMLKELGDVLWYTVEVAHDLGATMEEVRDLNYMKISSREQRGVLKGEGDNR